MEEAHVSLCWAGGFKLKPETLCLDPPPDGCSRDRAVASTVMVALEMLVVLLLHLTPESLRPEEVRQNGAQPLLRPDVQVLGQLNNPLCCVVFKVHSRKSESAGSLRARVTVFAALSAGEEGLCIVNSF